MRPRTEDDLSALAAVVEASHAADGYPRILGSEGGAAFLRSADELAAWSASLDGQLVGHVALRDSVRPTVTELVASTLGASTEAATVARLVVAAPARRHGVGSALLATAVDTAQRRGRTAVLDVDESLIGALALYAALGWRALGSVTVTLPDGTEMRETVFTAPATRERRSKVRWKLSVSRRPTEGA